MMVHPAWAVNSGSYSNQVPSARALSRANSMVATVDDATAVTFNAARLPAVPANNLSIGLTFQDIKTKYEGFNGVNDKTDNDLAITPNFHYSSKFNTDKWGFGLGINAPWGLATNWKTSSPLAYQATETNLSVININPAVGYQITDSFSIGAGLDYYWVNDVTMKKQIYGPGLVQSIDDNDLLGGGEAAATGSEPDNQQKLTGDGSELGWDLSLAYNIQQKHFFGIIFRRGAGVDVDGEVEMNNLTSNSSTLFGGSTYKTDAKSVVYVPNQLMMGYGLKVSDKWMVEADAEWQEWSASKEQKVDFAETDAARLAILNDGNPAPKNWEDVWSFGIGTEYLLNSKWALRGGYSYLNRAVPEDTFEPGLPDVAVHIISMGAGYNVTENLALDAGIQLFRTYKRSISNTYGDTSDPNGIGVDGKYQSTGGYYGLNMRYTFGRKG